MTSTLELAQNLIQRSSISPDDQGCQELIIERLMAMDFKIERLKFGDVDNLWARRGNQTPLFVFAGHTDVVPSGPPEKWDSPPFEPTIRDGYLYGRGAADMKSSIAAMVTACEAFIEQHPDHNGSIAFLITSDEEADAINGTVKVVEWLQQRNETIDWCLVGEPSSSKQFGDTIKNGRRGSLNAKLTIHGTQGHVAYPHLADNPIHRAAPVLADLAAEQWDQGNDFFPPTSFQITNVKSGTGVTNVVPGDIEILFNHRFSTELTQQQIQQRVHQIIEQHDVRYTLEWNLSGNPFLTAQGELIEASLQSIRNVLGIECQLSTAGGTSDGRFIAPTGAEVIELGPCNETIHKINERIGVEELEQVFQVYQAILKRLLVEGK